METNPGRRRPVPADCRILCSNVRDLVRNLSDLTVASFYYDILLSSDTFVSDMLHVLELLVLGFGRIVFFFRGKMSLGTRDGCLHTNGYGAVRQPKFECGCWEMQVFMVCGITQNFCVQSLPHP